MVNIPMKSTGAVDKNTVLSINELRVQGARTSKDIETLNRNTISDQDRQTGVAAGSSPQAGIVPDYSPQADSKPVVRSEGREAVSAPADKEIPALQKQIQKGQKAPLETGGSISGIKACFGWNSVNPQCDIDVSAFLLNADGKVPGDSWFVFYGQTESPDSSVHFLVDEGADREIIQVDFSKMDASVSKVVFALTINEAFEKNLNFSMLKDAYVRIMDEDSGNELVSFQMDEYYSNVISMMIGEVYLYNGKWKFNAVGNGVAKDLAGLCEMYGVQVG